MRSLSTVPTLAALLWPGVALADTAANDVSTDIGAGEHGPRSSAEMLIDDGEPILVIGRAEGYAALNSATATKTDTPLLDIPQTIDVITAEQIADQADRSLGDVLHYVPGVTVGQGEGNRDQITIRGQNTTADFFIDGVRDDVQYYRNLYNIERVEVLKGPYALIFGRGGGGGIINRVQKTPSSDARFGNFHASANSFGAWDVAADVNAPLSPKAALRINGFYENLANHRDHYSGERYAINPYIAASFGENWRAGLSYEYVKDDRVTDRGIPSLACAQPCTPEPLPEHQATFFGVPGVNRTGIEAHIVKARIDGEIAENLDWMTTLLYGNYDKFYTNVYASGPASSVFGVVPLKGYRDPTTRENLLAQSNLIWRTGLGASEHTVMFGVEAGRQDSTNKRYNAVLSDGTLDLAAIRYPSVDFPALNRNSGSRVRIFSAYAQDQIAFGEHLEVIAGIRYDSFDISGVDYAAVPEYAFARKDQKLSPRFGVVIKPRAELSFYGSYSQSFLPRSGDQFYNLTPTQANLAPEKFTNYEMGAKWQFAGSAYASAALFRLDRSNATTPDPANPAQSINVGGTRTEGIELAVVGSPLSNWQISGGYSYQNAYLDGNKTVRLAHVPRHQFALWNRYDASNVVGIGLGVIHQSGQYAAIRTNPSTTYLPSFTRIDAALFFTPSKRFQMQLNLENALNAKYFSDAHNNNNISPGAPINLRFTARLAL